MKLTTYPIWAFCICSNLDIITGGPHEFAVHGFAVMLRTTKWKLEKTKVKVVFRLQFHATNIPQGGWDKLFVCFIPTESGKIIAKTSKANVRNGTCKWADPIYETTRLLVDSRNKRYDDKLYNLIVGMGSSHASILGEATINLADYADALSPFIISLPLHGSDQGTILHVTVQLLTAKTGFREFEQQFDRGLQSSSNYSREVEPSTATSSPSELQISDYHENKVNARAHFRSASKELIPIMEETGTDQDFSDSPVEDNGPRDNSEGYNAESRDLNGPAHSQSTDNTDYSNNLAIALEENQRLRNSLQMAESFIFDLKQELNVLHNYANGMNIETQKITQHLTNEISSGLKLEREVMMLKSECSKFKDELQQLSEIKLRSQFMDKTQSQRVKGLFLVEGRIRELQKKILMFHESDISFINSDLEMILGIVQNLEKGTGVTGVVDLGDSQSLELLCQLNEAKAERGNLVKKMNEMECYYESLVQELEENRDRILVEFQKLRYEHATCKSETESIRLCMKDQILKFEKERLALSCVNEELEKRVMVAEAFVQELEENRDRIFNEFERLKTEHSTCDDTISTCKYETESIRHDLKHQMLKFTKEKQELERVKRELEKRVMSAESLVHEAEKNREQILEQFRCLKNEHSTCVDTISSLKAEAESIRGDMKDQTLKFAKEKHDLECVQEQLDKRVKTAEALVQELEKNREEILGELTSLQNEHSTCGDTILTQNNMNNRILKLEKDRHDLCCVNSELKKRVQELEEKQEHILGDFQSLKNEHSICGDAILTHKNLNNQILELEKEKHDLVCINLELKKQLQELEEKQEQILGEFQSLQNEHLTCGETILTHENMNKQILRLETERQDLGCANLELKKQVQELEEKQEQILGEFQSLQNEHSTCDDTILTHKNQNLKLEKEKHDLGCVNLELKKQIQELEEKQEQILVELKSLQNEHSTCGDVILTNESIDNQILELEKESHDLGCVNLELKKQVQELEGKQEQILGELKSLQSEHSTCGDRILTQNNMNNQILSLEKERHDLDCVNVELKKHVQELEEKQKDVMSEFQTLRSEHSACGDMISTHKDQILKLDKEMHDLGCLNLELKKQVQELEVKQDQILGEFQNLKDEHLTYKSETKSVRDDMEDQILKSGKRVSEFEENREKILLDFETLKTEHSTCGNAISAYKTETESTRVDMTKQILKLTEEKHALTCSNTELKKKITSLESALERGRLNYSIAVTKLQKNLDLLAAQVSSMFETNQNLVKQTFSSESCPKLAPKDDQLYEISCVRLLYLDVYSLILEEGLSEVRKYAQSLKPVQEKNEPEKPSESLRLAFMKEQCETTVQELKHRLFVSKRHGDDILIKLQDALDEIEIRKKSEASYLKKIDDLLFKVGGLEGDLESMQTELDCALLNLECCKEEKEKIVAQIIELEKMKNERSILKLMNYDSNFQDLQRELVQLHKANEELEGMYPRFKDFMGDGNTLGRVLALEIELAGALMMKKKSNIQFQSSFLKQHGDEEAIFRSFRDINELIKDTLEIKGKYVKVETELNEMHARYTQLSLQLAEVEGERQQLMMTVKNMR
ncbi:uncharacterized protein LOC143634879 [Bidens hawaiensis]|uniref:uncharacterized protein LOC143634879 n=1 Tax=Bidens hawaiensis TaxID=980011 RepID=UPI004049407C